MKDVGGLVELHRLFAAVLVLLAFGVSVVRAAADALPEDTNTIESLTPEQARKLAQEFPGVPVDVEFKGFGRTPLQKCLPLNGLKSLDAETAKPLAEYKSHLLLNGLTTLSADAAKSLEEHKIGWLSLDGLTTLSDEVAKALVKHKGVFLLNGLTSVSDEAATALAQHKGQLHLNGLTTLSDEAAKTLITCNGSLPSLTTLSAETARALVAAAEKWDGVLPNLTALDSPDSVEIAKALAARKGPLRLPNLRKISPKTLSALITKEDVEIPPIETLDLIAEPDGSPTDDFVIPEGFDLRQQQNRPRRPRQNR